MKNLSFAKIGISIAQLSIALFLFLAALAIPASAATFTVNSAADSNDADTSNNVCADSLGRCTLRAAIEQANVTIDARQGDDTINFALEAPSVINLTLGEISITGNTTIFGTSARDLIVQRSTADGTRNFRIFRIAGQSGTFAFISNLTIANGNVSNGGSDAGFEFLGGGISVFPNNSLDLVNVTVRNNSANFGGGIYNAGILSVQRSTLSNNTALQGGGINVGSIALTYLTNSTVSDNAANGNAATQGIGGGILLSNGTLILNNVTVAGNSATNFAGGIFSNDALKLRNTIVAANTATTESPDVRGSFMSLGNNLIGNAFGSNGFTTGNPNVNGDKVGITDNPINALLGPLQDNGGQTDTRALLEGSPAKDAGNNCVLNLTCNSFNPPTGLTTDQRSSVEFPRRVGSAVDIGAYEALNPTPIIVSLNPNNSGTGGNGFVLIVNGSNFVPESVVQWNGQNRVTTFVSSTQLRAQILASDVATIGQFPVTVFNPPPIGGTSNAVNFIVRNCSYALSPSSQAFSTSGGSGSINVTTGSECPYTATSNQSWVTITGNASGAGNGTITFAVAANVGPTRTATILIGGQTFTITQPSGCTYSISPASAAFPAAAANGSFNVTTSDSACTWTATSTAAWITINNPNGTGNGTVNYTLQNNTGPARAGTIALANLIFTVNQAAASTFVKTLYDFDGDARADVSVYRPSAGTWYVLGSQAGFVGQPFGVAEDLPASADYDGDGKSDFAVFRPSIGYFFILYSSNNQFVPVKVGQGNAGIPVSADYDGDGKADVAVFRPSGTFERINSSNGATQTLANFGQPGDIPLIADFDGDKKADWTVFRPSNGTWYVVNSNNGSTASARWGTAGDIPTPADFDGDGKTDLSVFRPSTGVWYRTNSSNGQFFALQFGISEDKPVAADYDGDGKADIAVYRPSNSTWYLQRSTAGFTGIQWGTNGDLPVPTVVR